MAKSVSHPDCVHCRFMVRHKSGEYRCQQHNITLYTPVSIFCNMLTQDDQKDESYHLWFRRNLTLDKYRPNTLYTWVETSIEATLVVHHGTSKIISSQKPASKRESYLIKKQQGHQQLKIDAEAIAPITSYRLWTAGVFWQIIRELRLAKRHYYSQQGYKLEDATD